MKRFLSITAGANALYLSLIISLIISLIVSALLVSVSYYKLLYQKNTTETELLSLLESGINFSLNNTGQLGLNTLLSSKETKSEVLVERKRYGLYESVGINAKYLKGEESTAYLSGGILGQEEKETALYIADLNSEIKIGENVHIWGKSYLPKQGFELTFSAQGSGLKPFEGTISQSAKQLPTFDLSQFSLSISNAELATYKSQDSIVNSFSNPTLILQANQARINLFGYMKGNVVLQSEEDVIISREAQLEDVIISARNVEIESGFKGSLQIFASDTIFLGEGVVLEYPSSLMLYEETENPHDKDLMEIGANSLINGTVICYAETGSVNNRKINIREGVEITGQIYGNSLVELNGQINGSVYAAKLHKASQVAVYDHYLSEIQINSTQRSAVFSPILPLNKSTKKQIVKWLF